MQVYNAYDKICWLAIVLFAATAFSYVIVLILKISPKFSSLSYSTHYPVH